MHVIIDADPIVYSAGYAAERRTLWAVIKAPEGLAEYYFVPNADDGTANAQLKSTLEFHPDWVLMEKWTETVPEPVDHALQIVKAVITAIIRAVTEHYGRDPDDISVLLSGPGNYREKLATIKPYKGNRDPDAKPHHYQAIRDYLTQRWAARVAHSREADDEASILAARDRARGVPYLIVSLDKDLDQIPGSHLDFRNKTFYEVSPQDADMYFWQQVLSGDPTDNIQGVRGIGPAKARKIVETIYDKGLSPNDTWEVIAAHFAPEYGDEYLESALETARLVYLQREPGELWTPHGQPKEFLEESLDD